MDLNYFLGKPCTILVIPSALPTDFYNKEQIMLQYCGIVENIDKQGICIRNLAYKSKNFFFFPSIIGICEEQMLDANDPQVKIMEEASKKEEIKEVRIMPAPVLPPQESAFVDIKSLQKLAAYSKNELSKEIKPLK